MDVTEVASATQGASLPCCQEATRIVYEEDCPLQAGNERVGWLVCVYRRVMSWLRVRGSEIQARTQDKAAYVTQASEMVMHISWTALDIHDGRLGVLRLLANLAKAYPGPEGERLIFFPALVCLLVRSWFIGAIGESYLKVGL